MPPRLLLVTLLFAAALAGVVLGRLGLRLDEAFAPAALAVLVVLLSARRRRGRLWLLLGPALILVGLWRAEAWRADREELAALIGSEVVVSGRIIDDPVSPRRNRTDFRVGDLRLDGEPMEGVVRVRTYRLSGLHRGDEIRLSGELSDGFGPWQAELFYPQLLGSSRGEGWLDAWRDRLIAGMRTSVTEPMASFGLGLLVGVRSLMPRDVQDQLAIVGLSHLVAVSGYNLTILVRASRTVLARAGRGLALAGSLWLVLGFVLLTGASASIVRAGVVAVMVLLADHYGRRFEPIPLILLAAAGTALWDPGDLTDLGWLLSFLAFFGILVLAPLLIARLRVPDRVVPRLLVESLAAHILTLPLIMYVFGQMSVVAPLANILVLPLIPLAMLLSFVAGLAGMFVPALSGWAGWPAEWLLRLILAVADGLARLPGAAREEGLTLAGMLLCYAAIVAGTVVLASAVKRRGLGAEHRSLLELSPAGIKKARVP